VAVKTFGCQCAVELWSLYLLLQLLNHRLLMQDNPHQLLWRQLLEAFGSELSAGMHPPYS